MSVNISKKKRDVLISRVKSIKDFISSCPQDQNTQNLLGYIGDILKEINRKKYGLVFEEHREKIDELLSTHIPILAEEPDLAINNGGEQNFLIEGDNLAALQLLEKTHKGKIDVIYIDPPYNTETDKFKFDDNIVDINDCFRHSKWASLMYKRLLEIKQLLSSNWTIFISIDNNELSSLKMLCDEVLGEGNYIGNIDWESKTKSQNTETSYQKLQPKCEYILTYGSDGTKHKFNLITLGQKDYSLKDEKGCYREHYLEIMNANDIRGRETMIFDISDGISTISPPNGKQWKIGKEQIALFKNRNDLFIRNGKVIIKMRPSDERTERTIPFWAFFDKTIGTAESAKKELNNILGNDHGFDTVKPTELIKKILFHSSNESSTILDFFAGSGTTGHAVLKLNAEDGGKRRFILCTNNENNICRDITYQRLKTVITGKRKDGSVYSDGMPGSLKYFKVDFVPVDDQMYYEYADQLLENIRTLVELENAADMDNNKSVSIIMDDDELDDFISSIEQHSECKSLYLSHDILISKDQEQKLHKNGIEIKTVPEYYYPDTESRGGDEY